MKRFIRYLYEYEQGKRIRNVGFVKVEVGSGETIVNMQGKGFHKSDDRKLRLYLFYEENGKMIGIRQAEVSLATPVLSWHLRYEKEDSDKISGVLIETAGGRRIAATWDDRPVDVSQMVEKSEVPIPDTKMIPVREEVKEENIVLENTESAPVVSNLPRETRKYTKIQRKDISRLARCEWKLANNQFLMYGFRNYHHLILIDEGKGLKLGVPGIYHIEEAKIAERFGFGEFLSVEEIDIILNKEEKHEDEQFGYWCRPVKKNRTEGEFSI